MEVELRGAAKVQTAAVEDVLRRLPRSRAHVDVHDEPGEDWMSLWWMVGGRGGADARALAGDILTSGPALYAVGRDEAGPAAVGRLSLVGRWAGIYCMAVRPDVRRRGHATDVLRALLVDATALGVRHTWLQAAADNAAALALYERAGFADVSSYHYRVSP
ncbi:hypothetical protein GCM10027174_02530 [Salinifilum aidingensis]